MMMVLFSNVAAASPLEFNKFFGMKLITCKSDSTSNEVITVDVYAGGDFSLFQEKLNFGEPAYLMIYTTKVGSMAFAAQMEKSANPGTEGAFVSFDGQRVEINKDVGRIIDPSGEVYPLTCSQ